MIVEQNINRHKENYKVDINSELTFLIFPLLATFVMYYYYLNSSNGLMITGLLLMILPAFIYKSEYVFYVLLFTISNERMFIAMSGGQSFIGILIILLAVKIFIENNKKINISILFCIISMLILMFFKNIIFSQLEMDMDLIRFILNSYIFITIINIYKDDIERLALNSMVFYSLGVILTSSISLYHKIIMGNSLSRIAIYRFAGLRNDANYYAVTVALAISMMIILYFKREKKSIQTISVVIILFLFGGLSLSRGFIVANILNVILILALTKKSKIKKRLILSFVIVIIIFIVLTNSNSVINIISQQFLHRFEVDSIDSGRLSIWSTYISTLTANSKNLFFGLGRFNKDLFSMKYGLTNVAHNILIGSIVSYGLLLTLMILIIFIVLFFNFRKTLQIKRWKIYYNIPLLVIISGYLFLDAMSSNSFFYGFCLCMLAGYLLYVSDSKKIIG